MNRYPLWKYVLILLIVSLGTLYALPNIYGQSPVVQVKAQEESAISQATVEKIGQILDDANINHDQVVVDGETAIVKFSELDEQLKAQDVLSKEMKGFDSAMNLKPNVPDWLANLGGSAMNLGLDLRGGVYFLLEVDMGEATENKKKQIRSDITATLIKERIPKKTDRLE